MENNKDISLVLDVLVNSDVKTVLDEINSDKYLWNGTDNGDTTTKYQARKCVQTALVLSLASRIMLMESDIDDIVTGKKDVGITFDDARNLFYDHIRKLGNQYSSDSTTDEIRLDIIPNLYKSVANYIPEK